MSLVKAHQCPGCEALFEQPGPPKFECSSCGNEQLVEDGDPRNCDQCHKFMAKLADETCPECEEPLEGDTAVEAWRGTEDGKLYASEEDERQFIADAPKRAAQRAEADRQFAELSAENHRKALVRNTEMRPRLERLLELLGDRAPRLRWTVADMLKDLDYDPGYPGERQVSLYFTELAALFAPGHNLGPLADYGLDYEVRRQLEVPIRASICGIFVYTGAPDDFVSRTSDPWFTYGTGLGFALHRAAPVLVNALEGRKA